jgi:hypothetical protein
MVKSLNIIDSKSSDEKNFRANIKKKIIDSSAINDILDDLLKKLDGDKLPDSDNRGFGIFDIESVSHPGEYRLVQDKIQWINNPPSDGQKYTITYRPALTLQHIHVDSFNESSRGWTY